MKYPKRRQWKHTKKRWRVRNWAEYEAGLRQRGDLTIWLSDAAIKAWCPRSSGKPGGQRKFADVAIETAWTIAMIYRLPLRQTEGFLTSIFRRLDLNLPVPDHTTITRRVRKLRKRRVPVTNSGRSIHLLIDSTGLRIHVGHLCAAPKRRAWRKLHLAVDRSSGEILGCDVTSHRTHDAARVPALLKQVAAPLASASADGAYDTEDVYRALHDHRPERRTKVIIQPRRDAQLVSDVTPEFADRNRHIRHIERQGRRAWAKHSGFTRRSLVANAVGRYKTIIGRDMRSRTPAGQRVEIGIGCKILNTMGRLGMPDSFCAG